MSTGSPPPSTTPDQSQPPHYPPQYPPGPFPPQMFYQPPPPQDGTDPPPAQYMVYPPNVMYAYPGVPTPQPFYAPNPNPSTQSESRQKRKQVKTACTNCATACKRCDESRPCERCEKYGIADSCVDGQRKERKKGVKRGPYKRKNKTGYVPPPPEWHTSPVDPTSAAQAGIQAIPFTASDGTIQYYPFLALPMPESAMGGPPPNGASDQQPHPMMSFMFHPGAFSCPPPHPYAPGYPPHMAGMTPPSPQQPSSDPPTTNRISGPSTSASSEDQAQTDSPRSPSKSDFPLSSTESPGPITIEDRSESRNIIEEEEDEEEDMEPVIVSSKS